MVLLLDEPFGALDAKVRKELRHWLRRLQEEIRITTLFVTHDQEEALEVADRVAILREGRIEQIGTPEEIYDNPATPFVCDFLGNVNLLTGRAREGAVIIGKTKFPAPGMGSGSETPATAFVRPHDIHVAREPGGPATLAARVKHSHAAGALAHLDLERLDNGEPFTVQLSKDQFRQLRPQPGERVYVELRNVRIFPKDS